MTQTPTGQEASAADSVFEVFAQRFSSTPRGARLARHLAVHQLHTWGIPHGTRASDTAALIVAELAANAATHGCVPGRDFELRLTLSGAASAAGLLRIEVTDTRGERRPPKPGEVVAPAPLAENRRGLLLVDLLASRWSVRERSGAPGKTVVAELDLRGTPHQPSHQPSYEPPYAGRTPSDPAQSPKTCGTSQVNSVLRERDPA